MLYWLVPWCIYHSLTGHTPFIVEQGVTSETVPVVGRKMSHLRWPRGIMGFTRAFRNLQGKFSTAIATFNFQPRFNFSLFQLPQRNRYFQRSTAVPTFNRDSVFQRSSAIPTFNRDSVFQRSSAIPTFNHDSVFQLSSVNATFNCDWNS